MPRTPPLAGTSPSATFLLRPWAVVVRATVVGVAGRCRNPSRIGVRDMLSYHSLSGGAKTGCVASPNACAGVLFGCVAVQPPAGRTASPTATSAAATNPPATITPSPTTLVLPTLTATPSPTGTLRRYPPIRFSRRGPARLLPPQYRRGPSRPPRRRPALLQRQQHGRGP